MPVLRQIAQLGHPVLRSEALKVSVPPSASVRSLIEDMLVTLREADGVGVRLRKFTIGRDLPRCVAPNPRYPDARRWSPRS